MNRVQTPDRMLSDWLTECLSLLAIKPKTVVGYESLIRLVLRVMGDKPLSSIAPLDVQKFVIACSKEVSPSRTRQAYGYLRQSLEMAVTYGELETSPCVNIKLPRIPQNEMQFLSSDEVEALADECGRFGLFIRFLAYTGLRWGEAVALRMMDIEGQKVYVRRAQVDVNGKLSYSSPKNYKQRTVFMPASLAKDVQVWGEPEQLVFRSERNKNLRSPNFNRAVWRPAIKAIGKEGLRIHDLRHTYCALMVQAGVHPKAIQRAMGHSSITVTLDRYGHLLGNALEEAAGSLEKLLARDDED